MRKQFDNKTNTLLYQYILFANDCQTEKDFMFGRSLIEAYLEQNLFETTKDLIKEKRTKT